VRKGGSIIAGVGGFQSIAQGASTRSKTDHGEEGERGKGKGRRKK